jgi:hypothetical protein
VTNPGNPVLLFTIITWVFLLDPVNGNKIKLKQVKIDMLVLQCEKDNLLKFKNDSINY